MCKKFAQYIIYFTFSPPKNLSSGSWRRNAFFILPAFPEECQSLAKYSRRENFRWIFFDAVVSDDEGIASTARRYREVPLKSSSTPHHGIADAHQYWSLESA